MSPYRESPPNANDNGGDRRASLVASVILVLAWVLALHRFAADVKGGLLDPITVVCLGILVVVTAAALKMRSTPQG